MPSSLGDHVRHALSRAFGGDYLGEFVDIKVTVTALILLGLIALINFRGISESVRLNVGFTLVEIGGLLLIVLIAIVAVGQGDADVGRAFEFKEGSSVLAASLAGAALAFYALIGFEDSVNVAEEAREPTRTCPRGALRRAQGRRHPLPARDHRGLRPWSRRTSWRARPGRSSRS